MHACLYDTIIAVCVCAELIHEYFTLLLQAVWKILGFAKEHPAI